MITTTKPAEVRTLESRERRLGELVGRLQECLRHTVDSKSFPLLERHITDVAQAFVQSTSGLLSDVSLGPQGDIEIHALRHYHRKSYWQ